MQHAQNQQLLLDTFFSVVEPQRTLCFIYAKESPVSEDARRILIGVGRVTEIGDTMPYVQLGAGFGSVLWERVIRHSIRPTLEDGFLLPYHDILRLAAETGLDPSDYAVLVPDEFSLQFSYATEHVSHDAALALLLALDRAVEKIGPLVPGSWGDVRQWLSDRLAEVWLARGPCPGLGAALQAFGVQEGVLVAHAAQTQLDENEDPWPLIDRWLRDPSKEPEVQGRVGTLLSRTWAALTDERRSLLQVLSRFDLTIDQATRLYQPTERQRARMDASDQDLLANPYLIYELDRFAPDPVTVGLVDRGVFPDDNVRHQHPLPAPALVTEAVDPRRVRALVVDVLEGAAAEGDALRARSRVVQDIRDQPLQPSCPVSLDIMAVCEADLPPFVATATMADGEPAYQLARLSDAKKTIWRTVERRRKGARLQVEASWREVIDALLGPVPEADRAEEELARQEKAAALEVLATSRISALIGAAGTGKTTLLRALSKLPGVAEGGLLLLAPTGKARVRMQEAIGKPASTLAQTLVQIDRYDGETNRYRRSDQDRISPARTVIVDEASMLTEEALDALLDGVEGFDRLILVGDPRQLPPIGVGRPFVDIIEHLRQTVGGVVFPRVGPSYAELTIHRRQVGAGSDTDRSDLLLAEWFPGAVPSPGADEVWDRLGRGDDLGTIVVKTWQTAADLHELLRHELGTGLPDMDSEMDVHGFQVACGGTAHDGHVYFNVGAAAKAEAWQVLSPVRAEGGGVNELNRMLQHTYRSQTIELARKSWDRKIPKPAGPQGIVYGDKVMNVRNKKRRQFYPVIPDVMEYVANGEIGVMTGPFRRRGGRAPLGLLEVEFSTQRGTAYKFWMSELGGDDGSSVLELAYAITIHKSQGSEFGTTFVVMPNPCRPLSRELLYTALTRQRDRLVLLHQGELTDLKKYASPAYSETARRMTNLFRNPDPVEVDGTFLEAGLIHRTRKGIAVRSKSEVIIADLLYSKDIDFQYERRLDGDDGSWRAPDFTIVDDAGGITIYWEHLGMLHRPSYRRQWQKKLAWYASNGVLPYDDPAAGPRVLVTSEDGVDGSISSAAIEGLIDVLLG